VRSGLRLAAERPGAPAAAGTGAPGAFPPQSREDPSDSQRVQPAAPLVRIARPITWIPALCALAAVVAAEIAAPPAPLPGREPVATSWSELSAAPCARHGDRVRFTVQYHGVPARWHAGPTRFGPGAFRAFSAWADEQYPWDPASYAAPLVEVYARRGSEPERTLERAHPHQRFELVGVVREVWLGRPWIEIATAVPLPDEIGEATVFHAGRALELMGQGSFGLADEALQQALAAPLPPPAREELGRLRTICAAAIADPQAAPIRPRSRQDS
jgi:hypothetical protein